MKTKKKRFENDSFKLHKKLGKHFKQEKSKLSFAKSALSTFTNVSGTYQQPKKSKHTPEFCSQFMFKSFSQPNWNQKEKGGWAVNDMPNPEDEPKRAKKSNKPTSEVSNETGQQGSSHHVYSDLRDQQSVSVKNACNINAGVQLDTPKSKKRKKSHKHDKKMPRGLGKQISADNTEKKVLPSTSNESRKTSRKNEAKMEETVQGLTDSVTVVSAEDEIVRSNFNPFFASSELPNSSSEKEYSWQKAIRTRSYLSSARDAEIITCDDDQVFIPPLSMPNWSGYFGNDVTETCKMGLREVEILTKTASVQVDLMKVKRRKFKADEDSSQLDTDSSDEDASTDNCTEESGYSVLESSNSDIDEEESVRTVYKSYSTTQEGVTLVTVQVPEKLYLNGSLEVQLLHGVLHTAGYFFRKDGKYVSIYNLPGTYHKVLETRASRNETGSMSSELEEHLTRFLDDGEQEDIVPRLRSLCAKSDTVILLVRRKRDATYNCLEKQFHVLKQQSDELFLTKLPKMTFDLRKQWKAIGSSLVVQRSADKDIRVLVCGSQNSGKSTLLRYLVNRTLNICDKVCYIDADPGQSELTPPGFVSLVEVTEPLLGPPYTHLKSPVLSFFQGSAQVDQNVDTYLQSVKAVAEKYFEDAGGSPLFINTMGWKQDMGVKLLLDVIHLCKPTHVLQIRSNNVEKDLPLMDERYVSTAPSWCNSKSPWTNFELVEVAKCETARGRGKAFVEREISLLSHLVRMQDPDVAEVNSFHDIVPYRVPWNSVRILFANGQSLEDSLYSIIGSLVALCSSESRKGGDGVPSIMQSFGYGVVVAVDLQRRSFYIATPLPHSVLPTVDTLIKGDIDVPTALLLGSNAPISGSYIPYLSVGGDEKRMASSRASLRQIGLDRRSFPAPQ